ncbi:unnamed protein product [Allacma fusca]|uniref:CRAL-TRIO domain-containing protein n=1 Tax=Allacma fusca TaxID=39272 RepID=A0A8J2LG90_9HEXA|nr:unnamed protein product [Allacma fusca]
MKATKVEYIPEIASQFKVASHPKSKSGYPVYQAFAGRFRFRDTIAKHGKESVIYYWMQLLAKAESFIVDWNRGLHKQYGNSVSNWPLSRKSWVILDMASIQYMELLSRDVISIFLALVKMAINYFPAIEGNLIFLNAGRIMEFFFKMIRPMLKGSNIDMYVMGSKDEKYKSFVLEYVDANQLMESFGGILSDDLLL